MGIEDQINHFHHNNVNITSIIRLDKDIDHLFRTLGMLGNRAERLKINANKTSDFTEGKRRLTKTDYRVFSGNSTSKISTTGPGKYFNTSEEKD